VIQQQGDEGERWHRTLIDPTLLRVLGPLEGQHVLDLACGNGYYTQTPEVAVLSSREPRVYSPPYILGVLPTRCATVPLIRVCSGPFYAGSCILTSENSSSTHSGE
jgi:hypothetical protein